MAINFADERVLKSQRALSLLPADSNTNPEVFWKAYFLLKLSKSVQVIPFKEQQTTPWNIGQMHYFLVWHKWSGRFCYLHGELIKSPNLEMSHAIYGKQFGLAVAKRSPDQKSKATTRMEGNKAWSRSNHAPFWTGVQTDKKPGACGFEFYPSERRCRNSVQKRQCYRHRLQNLVCQSLISGSERGKDNADIFLSAENINMAIWTSHGWFQRLKDLYELVNRSQLVSFSLCKCVDAFSFFFRVSLHYSFWFSVICSFFADLLESRS